MDRVTRCIKVLALTLSLALPATIAHAGVSVDPPRSGALGMSHPLTESLLVDYYEGFLRDQDIESFRVRTTTRYTEGTLARLVESGGVQARRAAVLALGLSGSYTVNATLARGLRDSDLTVRRLSGDALWMVWFRAGTLEQNRVLGEVADLVNRGNPAQAITLATRLIADAPDFAEAYNQRAIAYFQLARYDESAADCRRVLERNPVHFGALGGLAQCQLKLGQHRDALGTYRRALKLQPYSDGLKGIIAELETQLD